MSAPALFGLMLLNVFHEWSIKQMDDIYIHIYIHSLAILSVLMIEGQGQAILFPLRRSSSTGGIWDFMEDRPKGNLTVHQKDNWTIIVMAGS